MLKINTNKSALIDPEKNLHEHGVFWFFLIAPVIVGVAMLITVLYQFEVSWTYSGFSFFLEHAKLPLFVMSLSITLGTLFGLAHRSSQSAMQIRLTEELSRFKDFKEHRDSFLSEMEFLKSNEVAKDIDLHFMYRSMYEKSIERDYRPRLPEPWVRLASEIKLGKLANAHDLLSISEYASVTSSRDVMQKAIDEKINVVISFFRMAHECSHYFVKNDLNDDILTLFGVDDEDSFLRSVKELSETTDEDISFLGLVVNAIASSSAYHFMEQQDIETINTLSQLQTAYYEKVEDTEVMMLDIALPPDVMTLLNDGQEHNVLILSYSIQQGVM